MAGGAGPIAAGNSRAVSFAKDAYDLQAPVIVAASTLAEVLPGGGRDSDVHRVLRRIDVSPIDKTKARAAGELLGRLGLSGHENALDALVAVVALAQPRPVVLLTSHTDDMTRLTHEAGRPARERIAVVRI